MRVLQIHNAYRQLGGEDVAVAQDRELLASHGHEVEQLIVRNPDARLASATAMVRAPWNRAAAQRVVAAARAFRPDVVHVHNTWFSLSPAAFAALSKDGWPVVTTLHNYRTVCVNGLLLRQGHDCDLCVGSNPGHAIVHRCYRGSALLSASAALTIGVARRQNVWAEDVSVCFVLEEAAVPLIAAGGVPPDRILVKPHFVDDPGPRRMPPSAFREVVYAGRLSPEKGAQILLEAWRQVGPSSLHLTIYGDGPLRTELEARHVPGVTFKGRVAREQVSAALLEARCLVFPSTCREAGLVPVEAAAAGTPILASNLVSMAERLQQSNAGWSSPAGDAGALGALLTALADGDQVDRAGQAARQLYAGRHTPEAALRLLEEGYERAVTRSLDNRGKPRY